MESFETMYNRLTLLIRENVEAAEVSSEYTKLLKAYPNAESRVRTMLDSAFDEHGVYKTSMGMFDHGHTHSMTEIGRATSGTYSKNRELHYNRKNLRKS